MSFQFLFECACVSSLIVGFLHTLLVGKQHTSALREKMTFFDNLLWHIGINITHKYYTDLH